MNNCLFLFLSCCSGTGIFCLVEKTDTKITVFVYGGWRDESQKAIELNSKWNPFSFTTSHVNYTINAQLNSSRVQCKLLHYLLKASVGFGAGSLSTSAPQTSWRRHGSVPAQSILHRTAHCLWCVVKIRRRTTSSPRTVTHCTPGVTESGTQTASLRIAGKVPRSRSMGCQSSKYS